MLLTVSHLSKSYGVQAVLQDLAFTLEPDARMGIVGANGAGKSTLCKILAGEVEADGGEIRLSPGTTLGYMPQAVPALENQTLQEFLDDALAALRQLEATVRELQAALSDASDVSDELQELLTEYAKVSDEFERRGGFEAERNIERVLGGLGLGTLPRDRAVAALSGGEKGRLALAALLLRAPDLLVLDEPTNHLDFQMLDWLETWITGHHGAALIVSHDRRFLNRTVDSLFEIDEHTGQGKHYAGDYEAYLAAKTQERAQQAREYERQQKELHELRQALKGPARTVAHNRPARDADKFVVHFKGERVQQAVSRNVQAIEEKIARIEAHPLPRPPEPLRLNLGFDPQALVGRIPITASGISKSYDGRLVLDDISLMLSADSRVVLTGPNGSGKTTLLRILAGLETPDAGTVTRTPTLRIGYLDQELRGLEMRQTALEVYCQGLAEPREKSVANLIRFGLFTYDDVNKRVEELSLGQRRKLQIARLAAERANLLLLDEPTHHLAFDVLQDLEQALLGFPGPILAVSHDRWFIERLGREVWELLGGRLLKG